MTKKFLAVILTIAICMTLAACGNNDNGNNKDEATFLFKDDAGRDVEIPMNLSRITPSGPTAQLMLYALAPEMLVSLSNSWKDYAAEIIPEEYRTLPSFGQYYNSKDTNLEALVAAEPQLVIDMGEYKQGMEEDLDNFTLQTGIPIIFLETDLAGTGETFQKLGLLLGKENEAEALADYCNEVYSRTEEIMNQVGDKKVRTLFIQGEDGLNALAKGSYQAQLIDMLTDNVAVVETVSEKGLGNEVSLEQIALWDPDFVIFGNGSVYDTVKDIPGWREVTAIVNDNYVEAPFNPYSWMGTPPSVQRYLALSWIPSVLYPEYCDYDIKEEVTEYYELFYHCNLTDAQYDKLTDKAF